MDENWQSKISLKNAIAKLFNDEFMADIKFKIKQTKLNNNQTSSSKEIIIFAHSQILSARSYKFYQQFKTESGGGMKKITITDYSSEIMLNFLQYLYTDETEIHANNVWNLIELASLYIVTTLERKCTDFLLENATVNGLCEILERSIQNNIKCLYDQTLNLVQINLREIFKTESFLCINQKTLELILSSETVKVGSETEMLDAAIAWSDYSDVNGNKTRSPKKKMLNNKLLKLIRFPTMKPKELELCIKNHPELFKFHEIPEIISQSNGYSPVNQNTTWIIKNRTYLDLDYEQLSTCYLSIGSVDGQVYDVTPSGVTKFKVDKVIAISALCISGTHYYNPCDISILDDSMAVLSKLENVQFTEWGGEIVFTKPIQIVPNYEYQIVIEYSKKEGKFLGHSNINDFPHVCYENYVEFTFNEISPMLYFIHFKIV